jgi:hypothetical protein
VVLLFVVVLALVGAFLWWRGGPSRGSERESVRASLAAPTALPQVLQPAVGPPADAGPAPLGLREEAPSTPSSESAELERVPLVAGDDEALVRARVVDLGRQPRADVRLLFVPEEDGLPLEQAETDERGTIELLLEPGRYRITGGALGVRMEPMRVVLIAGENELGDLLLPVTLGQAFLAGKVHSASEELEPAGVVFLRDPASGREFAADVIFTLFGKSDGEATFRIEGLLPGPYRVSFVGVDGQEYLPAELEVVAPAEGLIFQAQAGKPRLYRFEILTASGSPAAEARVFVRFKGRWMLAAGEGGEGVSAAYCDEWLVLATGCRPERGRLPDEARVVAEDEQGREIVLVPVTLQPGAGAAILCLDVEGDGPLDVFGWPGAGGALEGVEGRIDGVAIAASDADGLLVFTAEGSPEHIELSKPGWRLIELRRDEEGTPLALFARQSP